jgi:hypothetical protein
VTLTRALVTCSLLVACGGSTRTSAGAGPLTPDALRSYDAKWQAAFAGANPSVEASRALASVPPGGEVLVVLGTWCGDSRREVSRFVKALDAAGPVPFGTRWIGVDREKKAPGFDAQALGIRYVPTFIVSRGGHEIGRVVESSPDGIELDVAALLREEKRGVISARPATP